MDASNAWLMVAKGCTNIQAVQLHYSCANGWVMLDKKNVHRDTGLHT